jgi:hypothetical protein
MYDETDYWWQSHKANFERLFLAFAAEYNPLENYDRNEEWTDNTAETGSNVGSRSIVSTKDGDTTHTLSSSEITDNDGTFSKTLSGREVIDNDGTSSKSIATTEEVEKEGSSDKTITNDTTEDTYKPTFNATSIGGPVEEVTTDHDGTEGIDTTESSTTDISTTETGTTTEDQTTTTSNSESGTTTDDTEKTTTLSESGTDDYTLNTAEQSNDSNSVSRNGAHSGRIHGNIGVTTSQQMLMSELPLRVMTAYGIIAKTFADELLLAIW